MSSNADRTPAGNGEVAPTFAVLGMGEAGREIASDLLAGGAQVRGFDPRPDRPCPRGATSCTDEADAVAGADVVLSVNSAHDAGAALQMGICRLGPGAVWADLNTASPRRKRELAGMAENAGRLFCDVAMMSPVPGRGIRTPMLASGPGSELFARWMRRFGTPVDLLEGVPGIMTAAAAPRATLADTAVALTYGHTIIPTTGTGQGGPVGKSGRVFLRGITSETYGLSEFRRRQLAAPRVRNDEVVVDDASVAHSGDSEESRTWWRLGPGDDPFLTQTVQVHFVQLPPGTSNHGHGHQNEAAFYILEGRGYEIHDDQRYDWAKDDLVLVHTDSVHRHFNPYDETATALVVKAKSAWMFLGLIQQGRSGPLPEPERFGERVEWGQIWTPGAAQRKKVVKPEDTKWEDTPLGRVRIMSSPERTDVRTFSMDVFELAIPAGGRSGRRWQMADEVLYVISGSGYSLHWEVEAEISEKYYARVAKRPTRHEFRAGDTIYIPQNTVAQHFASEGGEVRFLSAQNRIFKLLGYDSVVFLDEAGADGLPAAATATS